MKTSIIRRITAAAVATVAVALLSGCATNFSPSSRLERWSPGESKDLVLVRGVHTFQVEYLQKECVEGKEGKSNEGLVSGVNWVAFIQQNACPNVVEWKRISGFVKSDFGKGSVWAAGWIRPGLNVDVGDIVETSTLLDTEGRALRPNLVTRVIRKNALKERDPTCYWDGQSGRLDGFATGGVVCPAEGWDWRNQKWANK